MFTSKATLLQLFDRETKREKILEGIQREKHLKLRTSRGLQSVKKKMRVLGMETFSKVASRATEEEIEIDEGLVKAEKNFYNSIGKNLKDRQTKNKPIAYMDKYEYIWKIKWH